MRIPTLLAAMVLAACASHSEETQDLSETEDELVTSVTSADAHPELLVKDPRTLVPLEARFGISTMLGLPRIDRVPSGADLHEASAAYRSITRAVEEDVRAVQRADRSAGKGFAFAHRLFDERWLRSSEARLELTGITNRLDLSYRGGCGEVHFVYRLAYATKVGTSVVDSRLPFTMNVLVPQNDDGQKCRTVAARWRTLEGAPVETIREALQSGPLAALAKPSRVEINYQLVRWPSTTREDMGGHAEYALRAFELDGAGDLRPVPLDDTPRGDLAGPERTALLDWIKTNVAEIDQGTARVPAQFLATEVVSVAPRASSRMANRPFSALFNEADLVGAGVTLTGTSTVTSPAALLHKLDGITCNGCHQSRGIAGFHLLGEERVGTMRLNALQVGASPHLLESLSWRRDALRSAEAGEPLPRREAADHASGRAGVYGSHCTLGRDPGFAAWTCGAGLTCKAVEHELLGQCLSDGKPGFGDACEESKVSASVDPHRDTVTSREVACGEGANCLRAKGGFPDGMCQKRCDALGARLSSDGKTVCSGVPFGSGPLGGFNKCLFELKRPFAECLADDVRPTTARACDEANPCRDDYACVRIFTKGRDHDGAIGACMPPYFVFQGRVDGHRLSGL